MASDAAVISETTCKGCGGCVPLCPEDAIDLRGYTDAQVRAQIDSLLGGARRMTVPGIATSARWSARRWPCTAASSRRWRDEPRTIPEIAEAIGLPGHEVLVWVMGMRRYGWLREVKGSDGDGYFRYQAEDRAMTTLS